MDREAAFQKKETQDMSEMGACSKGTKYPCHMRCREEMIAGKTWNKRKGSGGAKVLKTSCG